MSLTEINCMMNLNPPFKTSLIYKPCAHPQKHSLLKKVLQMVLRGTTLDYKTALWSQAHGYYPLSAQLEVMLEKTYIFGSVQCTLHSGILKSGFGFPILYI